LVSVYHNISFTTYLLQHRDHFVAHFTSLHSPSTLERAVNTATPGFPQGHLSEAYTASRGFPLASNECAAKVLHCLCKLWCNSSTTATTNSVMNGREYAVGSDRGRDASSLVIAACLVDRRAGTGRNHFFSVIAH